MKTLKLNLPFIISLLIMATLFVLPRTWISVVIAIIVAIVWIYKIVLYNIKFKHERLKRWFPKQKWIIESLHQKYTWEKLTSSEKAELKKLENKYSNYKNACEKRVQTPMTFIEWCNKNVLTNK